MLGFPQYIEWLVNKRAQKDREVKDFGVHGNSLYFSLYFYVCFKFSIKWQKKKYSSCALATQFFSFKDNQISVSYHFL